MVQPVKSAANRTSNGSSSSCSSEGISIRGDPGSFEGVVVGSEEEAGVDDDSLEGECGCVAAAAPSAMKILAND